MTLCSECQRLKAAPTAPDAPSSFELNRRLPVPTSTSDHATYSYFTCRCGTRWVQVRYERDGVATWKTLR